MTCRQLGGACDKTFQAATFEEMVALSKAHGMEMFQKKDEAHLEAMYKMQEMMNDKEALNKWIEERRQEFEALPED